MEKNFVFVDRADGGKSRVTVERPARDFENNYPRFSKEE